MEKRRRVRELTVVSIQLFTSRKLTNVFVFYCFLYCAFIYIIYRRRNRGMGHGSHPGGPESPARAVTLLAREARDPALELC